MADNIAEIAYTITAKEVISKLETDPETGLDHSEVEKRRQKYGDNRLKKHQSKPVLFIFLEQFLDPVIYVLIVAAILGFSVGETIEAIAVLVVILITTLIGFFMEWQARRSMEALQKMGETHSIVLREGEEKNVRDHEIVPGDIILLETGDYVPADGRILSHENLAAKEGTLTGESSQESKSTDPLSEDTVLADQKNMVFSGTIITRGTAKVAVTATGEQTELGKISRLAREAVKETTPIEKKLSTLSKWLIWLTLSLAVLIAISGYIQGRELRHMIETAIALAVAAIPEGLPIVATIALTRGMMRLAKDRVIIKKLSSVETLGSTGIICTDKTGTLTENQMAVRSIHFQNEDIVLSGDKEKNEYSDLKGKKDFVLLLETGILCNNVEPDGQNGQMLGDPVEFALIELAEEVGFDVNEIREKYAEEVEIPFDAETKMMATLNREEEGYRISVKGALENVLEHCNKIYSDGNEISFDHKDEWLEEANKMAADGLRVLSFAFRNVKNQPPKDKFFEDLIFLGIAGFIDPPRNDVRSAMDICHQAGIRVIMVTGDHPETARNIAEQVGLLTKESRNGKVVTGKKLASLDLGDKKLEEELLKAVVFARVTPSQKLSLIELYQKNNYVVGMTGDGVNDAPALKKADIGIAMGIRGTEAAKEVADVILRDDQFTSIELAIRQGRIIFENIRKFVVYLLSSNLAEIISVAIASMTYLPLPLLPLQILYLNLVTDVFPALALGMGEGEKGIMDQPPRPLKEPIMLRIHWYSTIVYGLSITAGVLGVSAFAHFHLKLDSEQVNNMAFYTLVLGQLLNVFNLPKRQLSFFKNEVTRNLWVWGVIVLCVMLTGLGYFLEPLREVLSLVPLSGYHMIWVCIFSVISLILAQIVKRSGGTI